jgi:S-formylglutathione hydrolase
MSDSFMVGQLKPELLEAACATAGQSLSLRRREGYDHSYFFVSTFIDEHLAWHAERLS